MFKVPEKYRLRDAGAYSSDDSFGNNGAFRIPLEGGVVANIIASIDLMIF